ncbi:MAG: flagellar motor switch protein FliG [Acidobacteriota bacterium]
MMETARTASDKLTGAHKAAILLITLGDRAASEVLRCLPSNEVQRITAAISKIDYVSHETSAQVLEEFDRLLTAQEYLSMGGPEYAEKLLEKAFGDAEAKLLLSQALHGQEMKTLDLSNLSRTDPRQLVKLIEDEQPQTLALILAHLGSKVGSALLALLPEETRASIMERLAKMGQLSGETVQRVLLGLQGKFQSMGRQDNRLAYGGATAVAGILNEMDPTQSKMILETFEQNDPNLAVAIRDAMFTFEDLLTVPEKSIREGLGAIDKKTLAIALKGVSEDLKNHIFKCMSSRAVEMLKEDMESLGPMRVRDVAKAQSEIVSALRELEMAGKITLRSEEEDAFVV